MYSLPPSVSCVVHCLQGCYQGVLDHLTKNWYTWGGAAIGIAVGLVRLRQYVLSRLDIFCFEHTQNKGASIIIEN